VQGKHGNEWGQAFNAAQFLKEPIQNRNRIIGGRYKQPHVFHEYKKSFPGICPSILASEYKGSRVDTRRASRFYGRRLTIEECAYHQGFEIPKEWYDIPKDWPYTKGQWQKNLYEAIGNGVPVFMSRSFGEAYESTEF
jgi:site-specific DNA-cytosine methylase